MSSIDDRLLGDPYLWLEDVEGAEALAWTQERSRRTLQALQSDPRYAAVEAEVRKVVLAEDRIPDLDVRGGYVYELWQDGAHVRGIWRRVPIDGFRADQPSWEIVLDLDRLAQAEGENWVWKEATFLASSFERCMIALSRGGKDAVELREFDLKARQFVPGGFYVPEAKNRVAWVDVDTLLLSADFGPGSLTTSGYPREVRVWKRGQGYENSRCVFTAEASDVRAVGLVLHTSRGPLQLVARGIDFFTLELFVLRANDKLERVDIPGRSEIGGVHADRLLVWTKTGWHRCDAGGPRAFPQGSLVALPIEDFAHGKAELVFSPTVTAFVEDVRVTANAVVVSLLDKVTTRLVAYSFANGAWHAHDIELPPSGHASLAAASPSERTIYARYESFLTPARLIELDGSEGLVAARVVRSLSELFDAEPYATEQLHATSRDGTKVPYYIVCRKDLAFDGANPTLLHAYGGFEIAKTPMYLGTIGRTWLEQGGVYVLANIRGGGEFGPAWHEAALKEKRQRAFDDFIAVAEELIARRVTSPARLGISGGSNGGLLMGAAFTQRPELFNAVLCTVPLLDMLRYHVLLAGASWIGEYGNPEVPEERAYIERYSPYQNVHPGKTYPKVFFQTSTKDDRVHPGHARKMAARMEEQGHPVLYFENGEGGHCAAVNVEQQIRKAALDNVYLRQQLMS